MPTVVVAVFLHASSLAAQTARPIVLYDEGHNNNPSDGPLGEFLHIARSLEAEVRIGRRSLDQELEIAPRVLVIAGAMSIPRAEKTRIDRE